MLCKLEVLTITHPLKLEQNVFLWDNLIIQSNFLDMSKPLKFHCIVKEKAD